MPPEPATATPATAGIEALTGLVKDIQTKIDDDSKVIHLGLEDLKNGQKKLENWVAEVEKTAAKARSTNLANGEVDAIKSSIPERHKRALELHVRMGLPVERAIRMTALESWMKNSILLNNPQVANRVGSKLADEMDKIERSFGFEPVGKALQEDQATEGGNLLPTPVEAEVLRIELDAAVVSAMCRQVPMITKTHSFPSLSTNLSVAIVAEEGTITPGDPAFGTKALTAKKIATRCIASMELVQDSAIGILTFLTTLMAEQKGLFLDKQILEGDGTGSNFTGVVAAASVNEVFAAGAAAGNGAAPNYAQLIAQKWKGRKRSTRRGCAFVAAPEVLSKYEQLLDSQNRPLFVAPIAGSETLLNQGGGVAAADGTLQGFRAYSHDQILINRTVGTSTDCSNMYFGPWSVAVIVGRLLGMQFGVSEHTQWATGQLDLRMISRDAVLVAIPEAMTKQTGLRTT